MKYMSHGMVFTIFVKYKMSNTKMKADQDETKKMSLDWITSKLLTSLDNVFIKVVEVK